MWTRRLGCALLSVTLPACGWKVTAPPGADLYFTRKHVADAVLLNVDDGALLWGRGELGFTLRKDLVALGTFRNVYYPVEPRTPVPDRLIIKAGGAIREDVGFGVVKSFLIGALLFLPVGLVRFHRDFELTAEVTFAHTGREPRHFTIETATGVSHTMFSDADEYEPEIRRAAFSDLARRITSELSKDR